MARITAAVFEDSTRLGSARSACSTRPIRIGNRLHQRGLRQQTAIRHDRYSPGHLHYVDPDFLPDGHGPNRARSPSFDRTQQPGRFTRQREPGYLPETELPGVAVEPFRFQAQSQLDRADIARFRQDLSHRQHTEGLVIPHSPLPNVDGAKLAIENLVRRRQSFSMAAEIGITLKVDPGSIRLLRAKLRRNPKLLASRTRSLGSNVGQLALANKSPVTGVHDHDRSRDGLCLGNGARQLSLHHHLNSMVDRQHQVRARNGLFHHAAGVMLALGIVLNQAPSRLAL